MTQWQKMTDEQKRAQMERNTYYRHKRKAKELGISVEEYQASLKKGKRSKPSPKIEAAVSAKELTGKEGLEFPWEQKDNSHLGDSFIMDSVIRPWLSFEMERYTTPSGFSGFRVATIHKDVELKAYYDKLREEQELNTN